MPGIATSMSLEHQGSAPDIAAGAARIVARAGRAAGAEERRVAVTIEDFFLPDDGRLDDQARAAVTALLDVVVAAIESQLIAFAARTVEGPIAGKVLPRLVESGLLRDRALMKELVGRAREELVGEALSLSVARTEQSGLLARLVDCPDGVVAAAAAAFLVAESRVRAGRCDLPFALHQKLVWWIAAALREQRAPDQEFDRALADAAARSLNAHDDGDRVESAATRLAAAIDARPEELGMLLADALADARPALFVAAIARAARLDYREARAIALDPDGDRLWLVLRARGLDRPTIARIGLLLADADRRRDIESFADSLDAIVAIGSDDAIRAIAPMQLHPDFRAALHALAASRRA